MELSATEEEHMQLQKQNGEEQNEQADLHESTRASPLNRFLERRSAANLRVSRTVKQLNSGSSCMT